jgi:hypothetical protein
MEVEMADKAKKLVVRFTQQQLQWLDSLKKEGAFGQSYGEIIMRVFQEYVKQKGGYNGIIRQQ